MGTGPADEEVDGGGKRAGWTGAKMGGVASIQAWGWDGAWRAGSATVRARSVRQTKQVARRRDESLDDGDANSPLSSPLHPGHTSKRGDSMRCDARTRKHTHTTQTPFSYSSVQSLSSSLSSSSCSCRNLISGAAFARSCSAPCALWPFEYQYTSGPVERTSAPTSVLSRRGKAGPTLGLSWHQTWIVLLRGAV